MIISVSAQKLTKSLADSDFIPTFARRTYFLTLKIMHMKKKSKKREFFGKNVASYELLMYLCR